MVDINNYGDLRQAILDSHLVSAVTPINSFNIADGYDINVDLSLDEDMSIFEIDNLANRDSDHPESAPTKTFQINADTYENVPVFKIGYSSTKTVNYYIAFTTQYMLFISFNNDETEVVQALVITSLTATASGDASGDPYVTSMLM